MVEVIVRKKVKTKKDGTEVWENKKLLSEFFGIADNIQISYNNFGHLVMRLWKNENEGEELLVVLNSAETLKLLRYVMRHIRW